MNRQLLSGQVPDSTRASLAVTLCAENPLVQTTVSPAPLQALGNELHSFDAHRMRRSRGACAGREQRGAQARTRDARSFIGYFFAREDWTILA